MPTMYCKVNWHVNWRLELTARTKEWVCQLGAMAAAHKMCISLRGCNYLAMENWQYFITEKGAFLYLGEGKLSYVSHWHTTNTKSRNNLESSTQRTTIPWTKNSGLPYRAMFYLNPDLRYWVSFYYNIIVMLRLSPVCSGPSLSPGFS